jgi:hypothetical protein
MEQPARRPGNWSGCRYAIPTALPVSWVKQDTPALFWGIAKGRVDGLQTTPFGLSLVHRTCICWWTGIQGIEFLEAPSQSEARSYTRRVNIELRQTGNSVTL